MWLSRLLRPTSQRLTRPPPTTPTISRVTSTKPPNRPHQTRNRIIIPIAFLTISCALYIGNTWYQHYTRYSPHLAPYPDPVRKHLWKAVRPTNSTDDVLRHGQAAMEAYATLGVPRLTFELLLGELIVAAELRDRKAHEEAAEIYRRVRGDLVAVAEAEKDAERSARAVRLAVLTVLQFVRCVSGDDEKDEALLWAADMIVKERGRGGIVYLDDVRFAVALEERAKVYDGRDLVKASRFYEAAMGVNDGGDKQICG